MPKKIDKKKKVIKKKATKKPKDTKPKATPIIIYTQKLPRTKCCVDGEKTGEAYSIPFGFRDLAGTQRISQTLGGVSQTPTKTSVNKPISIETQTESNLVPIETQTEPETETILVPLKKKKPKKKVGLIIEEDTGTQTEPEVTISKERKKEIDKQKALSKLNDLFLVNYPPDVAFDLSASYNYQSISQINKRIKKEKELLGKLKS